MALVIADRVRETTTTTGTGAITLAGAYTSFQTFLAAVGNANSTYYTIASAVSGEWEVGIGTYTSSTNTLSRDTVLASSNSGSAVSFSAGVKDVFVTQPAERSLLVQSAGSGLFAGVAAFTANGVPYAGSTTTLTTGSALTFDGSQLGVIGSGTLEVARFGTSTDNTPSIGIYSNGSIRAKLRASSAETALLTQGNLPLLFGVNDTEAMRLTSTGLGIGTSSPGERLEVAGSNAMVKINASGSFSQLGYYNSGSLLWNAYADISSGEYRIGTASGIPLRISSSGNLGLGVTPKSGSGGIPCFEISGSGIGFTSQGAFNAFSQNVYYASGWKYAANGLAASYWQDAGVHKWFTAPSGTAGNAITFTQAMTLDASGNLGVGSTSPAFAGVGRALTIDSASASTGSIFWLKANGTSYGYLFSNNVETALSSVAALPLTFKTSDTERARIDSSGNLLVGTTSQLGASNARFNVLYDGSTFPWGAAFKSSADNGIDLVFISAGNGPVGSISHTSTATAYNTSSDYRLKDNTQPLTGSGAFIDALKPKTWNWKTDGSKGVGFIAHEVQEVSPQSVVGEKDAVDEDGNPIMQAMEYGSAELVANIVAEIQSLRKRIAALESAFSGTAS